MLCRSAPGAQAILANERKERNTVSCDCYMASNTDFPTYARKCAYSRLHLYDYDEPGFMREFGILWNLCYSRDVL